MRRIFSLLLLLGCSSLVTARDNAADQAKAHREIKALFERMADAEKAGDAVAVAQFFEGDAVLLPSSGEPVRGREDITRRFHAIFAGNAQHFPLDPEELWVLDDLAVSRGATRGPSPHRNVKGPVRNRFIMTLKRHGDSWEIHSLVWTPAPPAAK